MVANMLSLQEPEHNFVLPLIMKVVVVKNFS